MKLALALAGTIVVFFAVSRAIAGTPPTPAEKTPLAPALTGAKPAAAPTPTTSIAKPTAATPKPAQTPTLTNAKPAAPTSKPAPAKKPQPLTGTHELIAVRGAGGIYLVDPSTGTAQKIPGTAALVEPAWSPDGSLLAATLVDKRSVVTIRPDGTHLSLVMHGASSPAWSPDGSRIVVAADDGTYVSVRPDGTDAHEVSFDEDDVRLAGEIALKFTGNLLAFFENLAPSSVPAPDSFDSSDAAWSPDETQLVFTSTSNSTRSDGDLWIVDADDGTLHLLAREMTGRPSWRPAR
jgi:hypothetical protein